ncbi:MAG: SH3 domain-containing protein [Hyphomicrobiales bacterium]|nr:SH3 domain-containing protein [Hyphomicrobiales bacterium]
MATRATTNIRSRPTNRASIVRVVPGRLVLNVHARNGDWIEVGGTQAWGWVPSYLVEPFALKS